jgi:hypothetical protein
MEYFEERIHENKQSSYRTTSTQMRFVFESEQYDLDLKSLCVEELLDSFLLHLPNLVTL